MTPLTPEEQKMIDRILARGIAANDDAPLPDSGASEILAGIGLCILVIGGFVGMFLGAAWVHGWRPV